ncbi:GNAT family N-acetyltransferase [Agromyces sp. NPDC049794]|uniref:GNAT family N-acetyltransferase n=1 Tax=unclassified Agromyces TaxID=2639701 RepID=UPI0033F3A028
MRFREVDVASDEAHTLLDAYFAERAAGFPAAQGEYRPTYPTAEQFTPPAGAFLVVEDDDGGVIGCGGVRRIQRRPETLEVRFEIKHLWLRPEARGRGFGRRILDELERRATGFGAEELVLDTNASLEAAGGLYRSSGYAEVAPYNENPNATHWYAKRVQPQTR